jgi:hypothetical protein
LDQLDPAVTTTTALRYKRLRPAPDAEQLATVHEAQTPAAEAARIVIRRMTQSSVD